MYRTLLLNFIACLLLIVPCFAKEETFLLINGKTNEVVLELGPHIDKRISPCSTFKITLSLMGYDAGILEDENNPTWEFRDGYDDWLAAWKTPQTPKSWMQHSCVWYSKILSLQLGLESIQSYLTSMNYGNKDVSGGLAQPGPENVAWINSSLKISPREQVEFIQTMLQGKLSLSPHAVKMTKAIVFKEQLAGGRKLFGKTGWSGHDITKDGQTLEHSWFVGWVEEGDLFLPFAYLIRDKKIDLAQRIPRVKELLEQSMIP